MILIQFSCIRAALQDNIEIVQQSITEASINIIVRDTLENVASRYKVFLLILLFIYCVPN